MELFQICLNRRNMVDNECAISPQYTILALILKNENNLNNFNGIQIFNDRRVR